MRSKKISHKNHGVAGLALLIALFALLAVILAVRVFASQEQTAYIPPNVVTKIAEYIPRMPAIPSAELPSQQLTPTPAMEQDELPVAEGRFAGIELTQSEIDMLAALVFLEARNQSAEGQQAVVEVVLNRVLADNFPGSVQDVLFQPGQFSPAALIPYTVGGPAQYDAVTAAISGENILPEDVVYFSTMGENNRVWGTIGDHVFCQQYTWG